MNNADLIRVLEGIKMDNKEFYHAIYALVNEQYKQIRVLNEQVAELKAALNIQKTNPNEPQTVVPNNEGNVMGPR